MTGRAWLRQLVGDPAPRMSRFDPLWNLWRTRWHQALVLRLCPVTVILHAPILMYLSHTLYNLCSWQRR